MKTLEFKIVGRKAFLLSEKYSDAAKDAFSFVAPGVRYSYQFKKWQQEKALGIPEDERQGWDGKTHMMRNGSVDVGLLLGATADLEKAGFEVKIKKWLDRPYLFPKKGFIEQNKQYEYQNTCVENMLAAIADGGGLVLAATGVGKTKTAAQFFSWIEGPCLFVVDTIDLLYQSQKEIQEWLVKEGYDKTVGVVGNGEFEPARITVATIQTLHKQAGRKKVREWLRSIDIILIDEIHTQMARRNFGVINTAKPQAVFGLTATMQLKRKPVRFKCYSICGPIIFEFPMEKGVEAGVLSQGVVVQVPILKNNEPREFSIVKGKKKEVDDYVHEVVNNKNLYSFIFGLVAQCISVEDLCVAVLVDRVKHVKKLTRTLANFDPQVFYGAIAVATRKKQLRTFDKGKENLIIANRVFTKGINLKRIDVVIDAAQKSSRNDCIQKFGRAVRLHAEKAGILYFDCFTEGKLEKSAKSRKGAFKQAKIPIKVLEAGPVQWRGKDVLPIADKLLTAALKNNKAKSDQGKLF